MIDFKPIALKDKPLYEGYLWNSAPRGCEFSFINVYLWGQQNFALLNGCLVLLSHFGALTVYSYPLGGGDRMAAISNIIADSKERGIPCLIGGMMPEEKEWLSENFPDRFEYRTNVGSYDYIYSIDALADLKGKKYHGKRNHINRFCENYPNCTLEPVSERNIAAVSQMAEEWFKNRECALPENNFTMERAALDRLFSDFPASGAEGLVLKNDEAVIAFTVGSRFREDTFDVHFEKARWDVDGAYTVINCEFAKYLRAKYPAVRYLDREEDMGLEGLRQAKKSYHPLYQVEKWQAVLKDE